MKHVAVRRIGGRDVSVPWGPPPPDDEPPPDFRTSSSSARDEAFHWIMLGTIPAAATFVMMPLASAASFAAGLLAGGIAYATHDRRRKRARRGESQHDERSV